MSRPVSLFLFLVVALLLILAVATGLGWNSTAREIVRLGNVEVRIPDAERWWTRAAQCLGDPTPYNRRTRWFVGTAIPASWLSDAERHRSYRGYTAPGEPIVLVADPTDSAIVAHEEWHVLHVRDHPDSIFNPPRCGLAAPSLAHVL